MTTDLRHNSGVTLVEMLVVLGVILVLSSIAVTLTLRVENQSKENALRNGFAVVGTSLREYYEFQGQFPVQTERILWQTPTNPQSYQTALDKVRVHMTWMIWELRAVPAARQVLDQVGPALVKSPDWAGFIKNINWTTQNLAVITDPQHLCDPWGTVIDYICAADDTCPELISAGPDKVFGTADDISNKGKR